MSASDSPSSRGGGDFLLSAESAAAYLIDRGACRAADPLLCRELGGGVSNTVVLVESGNERFILKQALPRLRVRDEWLADRSRVFHERDGLDDVSRLLPAGWVPRVLWSDERNYLFAMEAAPEPQVFWKEHLLKGRIESRWARRAGIALGLTIRGSRGNEAFQRKYGDRTAFDQLRTDPYYRTIAARNPDVADAVGEWLPQTAGRRLALVHGDWSPKNMLLTPRGMVFIDYECIHYGDPSFDAAFCLNHFLLKAFHRTESAAEYLYLARVFFTWVLAVLPGDMLGTIDTFESATMRHLGFLLLGRVDGKSPVEYITDEARRERIRATSKKMIAQRAPDLETNLALAFSAIEALR